ncbi:HD domain-containing protein [Pseudomonas schmalbachii]|uniref:HD domain-containing protein n=1 Tax=Pseudomonas schmalbachii TaxID=2816993 RepID=A0ABS3TK90_9PSED|nr:HD domain-containing protein [Pseudomonas schmalbachii]MBO3273833.1 HD domain-containing protein [Pseudomonas schmalbachii]
MKLATFKRMEDSTREDFEIITPQMTEFAGNLADRVLAHLALLKGEHSGFPIDRYDHSLQTATLALRDGRDEEYVVCALLHDIGDSLGSYNHADIAAAILKPFVSGANHWMIENHAVFQGHNFFHHVGLDRDKRDMFAGHPHYERTAEFIELYDNPAFDPDGETLPIETFEPMVRRLFARPRRSLYMKKEACEG